MNIHCHEQSGCGSNVEVSRLFAIKNLGIRKFKIMYCHRDHRELRGKWDSCLLFLGVLWVLCG